MTHAIPDLNVGDAVFLRGSVHGTPGRILRIEGSVTVVLWVGIGPTFIGRHPLEALIPADPRCGIVLRSPYRHYRVFLGDLAYTGKQSPENLQRVDIQPEQTKDNNL